MTIPKDWPEIEYVKRPGMKTIRLRVSDERIIVSAPRFARNSEMQQFLLANQEWVNSTLAKLKKKKEAVQEVAKGQEGKLLLRGEWKPIEGVQNVRQPGLLMEKEDKIVYTYAVSADEKPQTEHLQALMKLIAKREIPPRVEVWAQKMNLQYERIFIRSQKTKWGTCSSNRHLSFNWRLIKCPLFVLEYLIVHELCHLVHMNHSHAFWKLVNQHYPEWRKAESWLKTQGKIAFLDP